MVVPRNGMLYQISHRTPAEDANRGKAKPKSSRAGKQSLCHRGAQSSLQRPRHIQPREAVVEPWGVVTALRLPKTTVFRVLSSLVERGYCECDPQTGKYSLGFELLRLAGIRRR